MKGRIEVLRMIATGRLVRAQAGKLAGVFKHYMGDGANSLVQHRRYPVFRLKDDGGLGCMQGVWDKDREAVLAVKQWPRGAIPMEHRTLGRTGRRLSLIGFGGVVLNHMDQAFADALVGEAFDLGIDYFDISPAYGTAQGLLGPALEPYRKHVFLACKADKRTKAEAAAQLRESLGVMHTDYFDLYQLHGVTSREEIETILGPGGALEALIEAKGKGLVRHLGFSAHTEEAALALMAAFDFDSILFPVNFAAWYGGNFGPRVLSMAEKKGLGILAIKALAKRRLNEGEERHKRNCWYAPVENEEEAELALRFTLSRPVAAAVSPGDAELMRWACKFAERFRPLQAEEELELERKARGLAPVFPVPG